MRLDSPISLWGDSARRAATHVAPGAIAGTDLPSRLCTTRDPDHQLRVLGHSRVEFDVSGRSQCNHDVRAGYQEAYTATLIQVRTAREAPRKAGSGVEHGGAFNTSGS